MGRCEKCVRKMFLCVIPYFLLNLTDLLTFAFIIAVSSDFQQSVIKITLFLHGMNMVHFKEIRIIISLIAAIICYVIA